ncbi:hypothetical protein [Vibrio sp. SCSIO 43136]|uniref:hypothetical protein n=1 Tax=Vibrio sp. SCSIO 43136 TaxID=2819101 RepID=UPI002075EC15|nr:hypothetical protein [Vibrio sp. SCSIO 43136]USD66235.1 hypothetical protein J4N39_05305 [Vibrio sp. SCSIO 43136]
MTTFKLLPIMAAVSLALSGCGSSSKSNDNPPAPTPTVYTWQLVHLASVTKNSTSCAVYASDTSDNTKEIVAYRGNTNTNVLIHNADGSVKTKLTPSSTGVVSITQSDIPDNGFVSVEELDGTIGNQQDIYMFAVQKSLMTNLTVNVRRKAAASTSCYTTNVAHTETAVDSDAVINVIQVSSSTARYQTSYIDSSVSGGTVGLKVPVRSELPAQDSVLVTLFDDYTSNEAKTLTHYGVADSSFVYNTNNTSTNSVIPTNRGVVPQGITFSGLTLNSALANRVDVAYKSEVYEWQPIFQTSSDYSFVTDQDPFSSWTFLLNGTSNSWNYHAMRVADGNAKTFSAPSVTALNATIDSNTCATGADYCVDSSGFTASDFSAQRTHIRSNTSNNSRVFYQTIYSEPGSEVALMKSSDASESLDPNSNTNRIEVSLAKVSSSASQTDSLAYFMEQSIDVQQLIGSTVPNFYDANGPVTQKTPQKQRYISLMGQDVEVLSAGVN